MKSYFYVNGNNETIGPVSLIELSLLRQQGQLNGETYVIEEGGSTWKSLAAVLASEPPATTKPPPAPIPPMPDAPPSRGNAIVEFLNSPHASVLPAVATPASSSGAGKRYANAYLVARTIIAAGKAFKALAIILGFVLPVAGFVLLKAQDTNLPAAFVFIGLGLGLVVGLFLVILGTLIEAQGEILMACLDQAMHTSPFLSKEEMAAVMKIK